MVSRIIIAILLAFVLPFTCFAQTTIWSVNFETGYSDNDASAQDNNSPAGADWSKSGSPSNWWRVESDNVLNGSLSMSGRNTDGVMTWTSESIDISAYSDVSISINIKEINCESGDIIETFYNLGSGNIEFGDGNGDGNFNNATNTITGLSGTSLTITVTLNNNGGGERLIFDDILVQGEIAGDGPGGVGNTSGSGSMVLWLDANQGVSTSGTAVTQWSDQSGYSNNCTPPAASNRPTLVDPGTNSHPIITFDGSTDYLTASDDNSLDLTTWSIVIVGIVNTHKNYNAFVVKGPDANENYEFLSNFPGTGNIHYPVYYTTGSRSTDSEPGESLSTSVYGIYQLDYDQSNFEIHINGDQTETDGETRTPQTNSNELYIGNEQSTTGRNINASLGEVIIYNSPLNTAERLILHNAMAAKYGFSMDANSLYDEDDSGFDFDVAGIGQASDGTNNTNAQGTGIVNIQNPSGLGNSEFLIWGHDNGALNSFGVTDLPATVESRLARIWRASETGEVGTVSISFDLSNVAGSITTSDLVLLIDQDNDGVFSDETPGGGGVIAGASNTTGNIYQWTGIDIDNNDRFTVGSINVSQTPLPVEFIHFEAIPYAEEKVVDLEWTTASETNNDYFTVERFKDLSEIDEIAQVPGQTFSNENTNYTYTDEAPYSGTSYYRIKQTDFDGKFSYSKIRRVELNLNSNSFEIYPNPATNELTIRNVNAFDQESIKVYNVLGQDMTFLIEAISSSEEETVINISGLSPAIYHLQIRGESRLFIKE